MAAEPLISVEHVDFAYDGHPVLRDCTLAVVTGEFLGVVGPNGGGKSTLLRLILGELRPSAGTVTVFGRPAIGLGRLRSLIGYVPQRETVNWEFPATALDVVIMGAFGSIGIGRRVGRRVRGRAQELLAMMGIPDLADRPVGRLSGGQQQRVFVARALICEPRLLLLDEPTRGIDIGGIEAFFGQIHRLKHSLDLTVVMVSHDLQHLRHVADRLACLHAAVHWHERADAVSDQLLAQVSDFCELEAYLTHNLEHHHHGRCGEGEPCAR